MTPAVSEVTSPAQDALDAAADVLEPLAGLLLSNQVRFAQAEELLKTAFVQACARAYAAQGKVATVSALSVATGIRRREVARLLSAPGAAAKPMSQAMQARLRWTTDPQFLDAGGQPLRLARVSTPGVRSFADLAATVSKDNHPRALLDEMVRIGAAEEQGDEVVLRHRFAVPDRSRAESLQVGCSNVGDHLSAVLLNLLSERAPLTERAISADGLTEASAQAATDLARDVWAQTLTGLRGQLQQLVDADASQPDNGWRMRIGLYSYLAPTERPPAPVSALPRAKADRLAADAASVAPVSPKRPRRGRSTTE